MFTENQLVLHLKTGNKYVYLGTAFLEAPLELYAVYKSLKDEKIWLRPLDEFNDGRFVAVKDQPSIKSL